LAEIIGMPNSTVARIIQQQEKLRNEWTLCHGQQGTTPRRELEGKVPDVEEALNQWFSIVTGQGVCVSGPVLRSKSEKLAKNWVIAISKQQMVVSMEMHVSDKIQEGTQ
jgi:hypothetical protein